MLRIGIVAGEASGDLLGAGLIRAIRQRYPHTEFVGIAGPQMQAAGCEALFPAEKLAVMGFTGVLARLPELLSIRRSLKAHFLNEPPDLFIGVDAPDFNLPLERMLREAGITTAHYVSPSVWAWRRSRLPKIARSVDLMLTLFPHEAEFYRQHQVPVQFVGHPLADMIPAQVDSQAYRRELGLAEAGTLVALLPGSRRSELKYLARPFIETALWCLRQRSELRFVVPFASQATRAMFEQALAECGQDLPIDLVDGHSREVMGAADVVLLASGTATLEALLLKRPMVVAYRMSAFNYWLARRLLTVKHYSLPNNLTEQPLVREFTQDEVTAENLGGEVLALLEDKSRAQAMRAAFEQVHQVLRRDASSEAARALLQLIEQG